MTTKQQAYNALSKAAENIGRNNNMQMWQQATSVQRKAALFGKKSVYQPTPEHLQVIRAMRQLQTNEISPDEAMNLLWQQDILKQRLGE